MGYLLPIDYLEIIYTTIENNLSPDLIRDFLFHKWELHKKDNPSFLDELGKQILFIGKEQDGILKSKFKALNIQKEHSVKLIDGYKLLIDKVENIEENTEERTAKKGIKIQWNGNLKEFAELIDSLEKNNWIKINDGDLSKNVQSLCECFDLSKTKKTKDSSTEESIYQILKPSEREHKIYTKKYTTKFNSISSNNKEK
jgi:hypothetical protein